VISTFIASLNKSNRPGSLLSTTGIIAYFRNSKFFIMSKLLSTLQIRNLSLKNRIVMSPMCQYTAVDGFASDWHLVHYGSRAVGGVALIIQEATAVSEEGRITPGDLGIYLEEHIEKLAVITTFIRDHDAIPGIQLAHAGRKAGCAKPWDGGRQLPVAKGGWTTFAPSALPFYPDDTVPHAMEADDLQKLIADFKAGAVRAIEAGYGLIEIHAAHGYLLHEFLSPLSNHRTDAYGGSFENRIRLLCEVVKVVREAIPAGTPLFVRISATDYVEGGWVVDEAVKLASILKTMGVDLIDTSSGGLVHFARIPFAPGYQVPFASRIRREANVMTGTVGLITGAGQAEEILAGEHADLVLIGRQLLRDPYFAMHAAADLGEEVPWILQYHRLKS
jgi:2,4-dienoyl-CoA reductase-like NADH-dependent reductase (Old Yellow Enzyme family)